MPIKIKIKINPIIVLECYSYCKEIFRRMKAANSTISLVSMIPSIICEYI